MTFFISTSFFLVISWIVFIYGLLTSKVLKSTRYGILAVAYVSHALSTKILGISWIFYFIFSLFFLLIYTINKKMENNLLESDINKKQENSNDSNS